MQPGPGVRLPWALIAWGGLGVLLNVGMARFTYGVMLPQLRRELGLDYVGSGALNAIHLAGYLVATLLTPAAARRFGMVRVARCGHGLVAAGAVICAAAPAIPFWGPVVLGLGRIATGLGAGPGITAVLVLVFASVPPAARGAVSAMVWSGLGLAIVGSGLAAPVLLGIGGAWRGAFVLSGAVALALAVAFPPKGTTVPAEESGSPAASHFPLAAIAGFRWIFLFGAYLMFGAGYIAYATFAGTRLAAMQAPLALVMLTWTTLGVAAIAGAVLTVRVLGIRRLRRHALSWAMLVAAIGSFVAILQGSAGSIAAATLIGLGFAATPAIITACVRDRCQAAQYARAFSLATASLGIGQLLGPVVAGALADRFGTVAVPVFAGAAYAVGTVLAVLDSVAVPGRDMPG
jgi:MFS family permease